MPNSPELAATLRDFSDAVGRYAEGGTALAFQDRARREQEKANEAASKRRMKEFQEHERLRAIEAAVSMGVSDIDENDSLKDVARKVRAFREAAATATLEVIDGQIESAKANTEAKKNAALAAINSSSMGTPEQRRNALQITLNDAAIQKLLPEKELKELQIIVSNAQDPKNAIQQVVTRLQGKGSYLFSVLPGVHAPGEWAKRAQTFFDTYSGHLAPQVEAKRQGELAFAVQDFKNSLDTEERVTTKGFASLEQYAGLLPTKVRTAWLTKHGPPKDAKGMDSLMRGIIGGQEPPAPAGPPPPTAEELEASRVPMVPPTVATATWSPRPGTASATTGRS